MTFSQKFHTTILCCCVSTEISSITDTLCCMILAIASCMRGINIIRPSIAYNSANINKHVYILYELYAAHMTEDMNEDGTTPN